MILTVLFMWVSLLSPRWGIPVYISASRTVEVFRGRSRKSQTESRTAVQEGEHKAKDKCGQPTGRSSQAFDLRRGLDLSHLEQARIQKCQVEIKSQLKIRYAVQIL